MGDTKISWATHVWNPTVGCSKVSVGCRFCYAEMMAKRLKAMGRPEYQSVVDEHGWTGKVVCIPHRLAQRFPKSARVFVDSMSDIFHEDIPAGFILEAFDLMAERKDVIWQVLTKRPERMASVLFGEEGGWYLGGGDYYPNIWLGVTAENQRCADERIPLLLDNWAGTTFASVEPLLSPVDLRPWLPMRHDDGTPYFSYRNGYKPFLNQVICGAESGPNRRPFDVAWAEALYQQCKAAGVSYFGKQNSGLYPGVPLILSDGIVHQWPEA